MAAWLDAHLPAGWRVMVSPATRTCETAGALTADFVIDSALSTSATPQGLLKAAGWPDGRGTVVVVGHQPTLGAAAGLALTGAIQPWNVKKGSIWWISRDDEGGVACETPLGSNLSPVAATLVNELFDLCALRTAKAEAGCALLSVVLRGVIQPEPQLKQIHLVRGRNGVFIKERDLIGRGIV